MIIEQILVTNMAVFCYLITSGKGSEGILIDPAGDFERIFQKIDLHDVKIKYIVNTHCHWDHASGNEYVNKKTGAQVLVHEKEHQNTSQEVPRYNNETQPSGPLAILKNGDIIKAGSLKLEVIHTPGHSEGSISLYTEGNIFTGDTLFTEGMGRTDLEGGSYKEIMKSIKNKILTLPDNTVIWPGHHYGREPKSTVEEQKNFYL